MYIYNVVIGMSGVFIREKIMENKSIQVTIIVGFCRQVSFFHVAFVRVAYFDLFIQISCLFTFG